MSDEFQTKNDVDVGTHKPFWFLERVRKAKEVIELFRLYPDYMTDWERAFCEGLDERFLATEEPHFSEAQELKMDEIIFKY